MCKAVMYGGGVAKGYLVYFLRDTWHVTDPRALHRKVASIALSAEIVAGRGTAPSDRRATVSLLEATKICRLTVWSDARLQINC